MDGQEVSQISDSQLISSLQTHTQIPVGQQSGQQPNEGLVLPVGETIRLDYIGSETVVTHLVSHEQAKMPGKWSLETTADGEVGTLMCQDVNGEFDMQDVYEVLKKKIVVKVATGEHWVIEESQDGAKKNALTLWIPSQPHTEQHRSSFWLGAPVPLQLSTYQCSIEPGLAGNQSSGIVLTCMSTCN